MEIPTVEQGILSQLWDIMLYGIKVDPEWSQAIETFAWAHLSEFTKDIWMSVLG